MTNTKQTTWMKISDPTPNEYREHVSLGHWESADATERIEHQRSEHGEGYYRYEVNAPDSGRNFDTLAEAQA